MALSVDKLESGVTLNSEALSILEGLTGWASSSNALSVFELVKFWARSSHADSSGHSVMNFASLDALSLSLDESVWAGLDLALSADEFVDVRVALYSDAFFSFLLVVLRTA